MIDEALQYAIDFCQDNLPPEEIAKRGETIIQTIGSRLGELGDAEGLTSYILGGVLKRLKHKDNWKLIAGVQEWETWGDFCKKMTGKSLGNCYAKIRVWEKSQKVGMTPDEVGRIGWSVADNILRQAKNRSDVDRLMGVYEEAGSREKFLEEIQNQDSETPKEKKIRKKRYLRLDDTEEQFYNSSLELAAEKAGKELHKNMSEEESLVFLIAQWREGLS